MTKKHNAPVGSGSRNQRLSADDVIRILNTHHFRKGEDMPGVGFCPKSPMEYGNACAYDMASRLVKWCRKGGRISDARVIWAEFSKILFQDDMYLIRLMGLLGRRYHDFADTHATDIGWIDFDTPLHVWRNNEFLTPAVRALCAYLAYRGIPFVEFDNDGNPKMFSFPDFSPRGVFKTDKDALTSALSFCEAFMEIEEDIFGVSTLKTNRTYKLDCLLAYGFLEDAVLPKNVLDSCSNDKAHPGRVMAYTVMMLTLKRRAFGDIVPIDLSSVAHIFDAGIRLDWDIQKMPKELTENLTEEQTALMDSLFGNYMTECPNTPGLWENTDMNGSLDDIWNTVITGEEAEALPEELRKKLTMMLPLVGMIETFASMDYQSFGNYANTLPEEEKRKIEEEYEARNLSKMGIPWSISNFSHDPNVHVLPTEDEVPEDARMGLKMVKVLFNRLDETVKEAYEYLDAARERSQEEERRKCTDFNLRGWIETNFREAISEDWKGDEYRTGRIRCLSGFRLAAERITDDRKLYATFADLCSAFFTLLHPLFHPCEECTLFDPSLLFETEPEDPFHSCFDPDYIPVSLAVDFARKCRKDDVFVCGGDQFSGWPLMTGIFTDDVDNFLAVVFAHSVETLEGKSDFSKDRLAGWISPIGQLANIILDDEGILRDEFTARTDEEPVPLWSLTFTRDGIAVRGMQA